MAKKPFDDDAVQSLRAAGGDAFDAINPDQWLGEIRGHDAEDRIAELTRQRDELLIAARHFSACGYPPEIRHRCSACVAARKIIREAEQARTAGGEG